MSKKVVSARPRIELREEDFINTTEEDFVVVPVRPTGNDSNYTEPFDIEISVRWWKNKSYVRTKSWKVDGVYNFPKPTREMKAFMRKV